MYYCRIDECDISERLKKILITFRNTNENDN